MLTVTIEATLHPAQEEVWNSDARFRVVGCGRRFGKTHLGVLEVIAHAVHTRGAMVWWVSPTHDQSKIAWRMFRSAVHEDGATFNETEKIAVFHDPINSRVQFKSADRDKNLRGEGLTFLVLDEAAYIKESAWHGALRPSLSDRKGKALLIGTFDGTENWFYKEWEQAHESAEAEAWRFPTSANPYIEPEEIEAARRSLPRAAFAQEYLADPMSFVGAVFSGEDVMRAVERGRGAVQRVEGGVRRKVLPTFAGLDWGYSHATALEVCEEDLEGRVHWFDERTWVMEQLDTRVDAVVELVKKYHIEAIYADAAGASENAKLLAALQHEELDTRLIRVPFGKRLGRETAKNAGIKARRWYLENDLEVLGAVPELIRTTKRYHYREGTEDVEKDDDHHVDAATCFYVSRRSRVAES